MANELKKNLSSSLSNTLYLFSCSLFYTIKVHDRKLEASNDVAFGLRLNLSTYNTVGLVYINTAGQLYIQILVYRHSPGIKSIPLNEL